MVKDFEVVHVDRHGLVTGAQLEQPGRTRHDNIATTDHTNGPVQLPVDEDLLTEDALDAVAVLTARTTEPSPRRSRPP